MQPLKKVDISVESRIVASIVSDTKLLEQTIDIIDPTLFESPTTQIVVEWATDYFKRLGEAPGAGLKDVFATRSSELNSADAELVWAYMKRGDWSPVGNLEFAKQQLEEYIRKRSMTKLVEKLSSKMASGNFKDCERAISDYLRPEINHTDCVDLFKDVSMASDTLNREEESCLFRFTGDVGATIGNFIASDFVLYLAPPKRGKTWWLMHTALQAALQGNNVLYISLEMDKYETEERFLQMLTGRSLHGEHVKCSGFTDMGDGTFKRDVEVVPTSEISRDTGALAKELGKALRYANGGSLKYMTKPTDSYAITDLRADLNKLEIEGFVPTVVVIDYVDIMKYNFGNEKRFGLDKLFLGLRGLNQERKFCLVSASQTGRGTVTGENDADEASIAEAVSKLNHATKIVLINQNKTEKDEGVYRINVNMARHGGVSYETCVCTSCLAIGRPCMDSMFLSKIYSPKLDPDGGSELNKSGMGRRKKGSYAE